MDSDTDKEYLYKIQLLQAFGVEQWDEKIIEPLLNDLHSNIKKDEHFRRILDVAKNSPKLGMMLSMMFQSNPEENLEEDVVKDRVNRMESMIFIMLFNFDFFDLFHKCICEHINNGVMNRNTYEEIMDQL